MEADPVARYQGQKSKLQERIGALRRDLDKLKIERKTMPKRVDMKDLPEPERFQRLLPERKHFVDTIKLIAYRAETSLASVLRDKLARSDDARALLRQIFRTEVDLTPELPAKTLTLRLHHLAQNAHDIAVRHLCDHLNATETLFPGADLRVVDSDVLDCRSDGREAARWRGCTQRSRAGSSTSLRGGQQAPSREIVPESISGGSNHRLRHTICEMTVSP